jgi:predicted nucleotidyltransferase
MTELELLADQVGASERTLRRAVGQGTLRAEWPTPRRLTISTAEKQYVRRSWPLLATLRAALRTEPSVRFALLFGSAARGEDKAQSDLDLLIEMRDPSLERVVDLSAKLEGLAGRRVDIVLLEDAERDPRLLGDAVRDGRVLVDREDLWAELGERKDSLMRQGREQDRHRARKALAEIDRFLAA